MGRRAVPWLAAGLVLLIIASSSSSSSAAAAAGGVAEGAGGGGTVPPRVGFSIAPTEGPASGGTQVTLTVHSGDPPRRHTEYWCQFGERTVAAQSVFLTPDHKARTAVLCQVPAGAARSSVPTRLSLDGHHYSVGPRFYYTDAPLMLSGAYGGKPA